MFFIMFFYVGLLWICFFDLLCFVVFLFCNCFLDFSFLGGASTHKPCNIVHYNMFVLYALQYIM